MEKFIVKYRKFILALAIILIIPAIIGFLNTRVNYDMLTYLPDSMETVKGQKELLDSFHKGAFSMIIAGSNELVSGIATALDGTKALYAGSQKLVAGFDTLKEYSTELVNGAKGIINNALVGTPDHKGLNLQIQDSAALMAIIQAREIGFPITTDNYIESIEALESYVPDMVYSLEQTKNLVTFALGTIGYTQGVDKAAVGATDLSNGLGSLVDGQTKLYQK